MLLGQAKLSANNMDTGPILPQLQHLTQVEEMLILANSGKSITCHMASLGIRVMLLTSLKVSLHLQKGCLALQPALTLFLYTNIETTKNYMYYTDTNKTYFSNRILKTHHFRIVGASKN